MPAQGGTFRAPCGCAGGLNSLDEPQGFSRECPAAREIFTRLMRDPAANGPGNSSTAELKRHIASQ